MPKLDAEVEVDFGELGVHVGRVSQVRESTFWAQFRDHTQAELTVGQHHYRIVVPAARQEPLHVNVADVTTCLFPCSKPARKKSHLVQHIDDMQRHGQTRAFLCTVCSYAAKKKSHLVQHMQRHEQTRAFRCTVCSYAAKRSVTLAEHMRRHTGEKPFKCARCPYAAAQRTTLNSHFKRRHMPSAKDKDTATMLLLMAAADPLHVNVLLR